MEDDCGAVKVQEDHGHPHPLLLRVYEGCASNIKKRKLTISSNNLKNKYSPNRKLRKKVWCMYI